MEALVAQKKKKNRRSLRKNKPRKWEKKFKLVGVNAAGLATKLKSLDFVLKEIDPTIFFIEETKMRTYGKIKTEIRSCQYNKILLCLMKSAVPGLKE